MISVVIPTRNRADLLALTLSSILKQNLAQSEFEVLVIDNGSTDSTQSVIREYQSKSTNIKSIYASEPGLHTGRHTGMTASQGDILVFADDDIEALPTWLNSIAEVFQDPNVAMVGGNNYPMFLDTPPIWFTKLWNRPTFRDYKAISSLSVIEFFGHTRTVSPYLIWGCNFSIRKEILLAAGGFHPDGMPKELIRFRGDGETHVSRYVADSGMKCVFHPGASVYHKVTPERMTFDYFRQRGFNQGVSDSYTQLRQQDASAGSFQSGFIRKAFGFVLRRSMEFFDDRDVKRAMTELQRGHREGFAYHQAVYRDDPEVRDWVHRSTYY